MIESGIREFKARVSYHVRRAQAGVRLTITDRGKPIAVLAPVEATHDAAWARAVVAEGGASWAGGKPAGLVQRVRSRGAAASHLVLDGRR